VKETVNKRTSSGNGDVPFDVNCRACKRLADFMDGVAQEFPDYHCRPVPPFGDAEARLLVVGLAPGKHGANASGRPFTGDHAGVLLYKTLYAYGFSSLPESRDRNDGLELYDCRLSNAVKCLPPENKPTTEEIRTCNRFLQADLSRLPRNGVIVALGKIAHDAVLRAKEMKLSSMKFAHAAEHQFTDGHRMIDSFHCSRYNTQTRRLTEPMFKKVFKIARKYVDKA